MKIIEILKSRNRTLLEMDIGMLFWTGIATAAGAALPLDAWGMAKSEYFAGLWAAALATAVSLLHMLRCLDRALSLERETAQKLIFRGYVIRYAVAVAIVILAAVTGLLNPLVLGLGYILLMKAAAFSQPFTHKLCNKLFHETDPVPEPVSDEEWNRK